LVDVQSPSTVVDPTLINTASAAAQLRNGTIVRMMGAMTPIIEMSGWITDELSDTYYTSGQTADDRIVLDLAHGKNPGAGGYDQIQGARVRAFQARQALQLYANNVPGVPNAWQGEMYALEGYTVVWFAELYCSGIPLTVVPLVGPQSPTQGFSTTELYARAIALFDSAMVAGADSAQYVNLARVGKARALLDLGQFSAADSVAQNVPTDFVYVIPSVTSADDGNGYFNFSNNFPNGSYRVQDREGGNGLVWSNDPRTGITTVPDMTSGMLWPAKYNRTDSGDPDPTTSRLGVSIRLADGLEARLIQAEVALSRGDASWLTTLNMLRSTCVGNAACAPISGLTTSSLPAMSDPGTPASRLDSLMSDRAKWLYLTGHREGDLRRLTRVYSRDRNTVWPTGVLSIPAFPNTFPVPGQENGMPYGPDTVYQPDQNEKLNNPLYGGCFDTNP